MSDKFDYKLFENLVKNKISSYEHLNPYPYAIFDDLFDDLLIDKVNLEVDQSEFEVDTRNISDEEVKTRSDFTDDTSVPEALKQVFEIINGGKFLNLVSELTSISGLIPDPYFDGGGVNIIKNGGLLLKNDIM